MCTLIVGNRYHQKSVHFTTLKLPGHMVSKYKEEEEKIFEIWYVQQSNEESLSFFF